MSPRSERIAAVVITFAAFVLFSIYSIATPLFEASDELWHYPMVQHLAAGNGLPVQRKDQTDADAPWRQEGSQPPLYYWVAAAFSAPFDSSNWRELRRINPHSDMGVPTIDGNANAILHTPAEAFPWTRAALAVRMARLVSILMSTATVAFSYLVARELFSKDIEKGDVRLAHIQSPALLRLAVPVLVATVPMFAYISGAINNDNAAVMFSTIGLWWALRLMRMGDVSWRSALVAGIIAGLGALSKSSALGLVGLFGLAAVLARSQTSEAERTTRETRKTAIWRLASDLWHLGFWFLIVGAVTLLISGWWFVRNQQLYGDLLGWNAFLDVVGRRDTPASLAQLWTEREGFVWAYWGVFGTLNVIMTPVIYDVLNAIAGVAVAACAVPLVLSVARKSLSANVVRRLVLSAAWVMVVFVALLRWTSLTPASQGRLLFPCIAIIAAVMAYGLWRIHRFVLMAVCAAFAVLAIAVPFVFIAPTYAQPANAWVARLPQPVNATFANDLVLVEAASSSQTALPGDEITLRLNWQLTTPLSANVSVFVHLIDDNDVIIAQRDMHPGQGNIATAEVPASYRWSDHYTLRIPALASAPRHLRWAVGVYNYATGERLALADGTDRAIFGSVELMARPSITLLRYANGVNLLGYTLVPTATLRPGGTLTITSRWQATQPINQDLTLSVQLLDDNANKIAQQDAGQTLTQWKAGETVEIAHTLQLNADAPPGVYRMLMVWYAPGDFARTPAYDARGVFAGDQIELTRIRVK